MEKIQEIVNETIGSLNAIEDSIKEKGVSVEEGTKPRELANKVTEVYKAGIDSMWDIHQDHGNRTNYTSAFSRWTTEYIRPKYKVSPTEAMGATQVFYNCRSLKKVEAAYFDFSQKSQELASSNTNYGYYYMFANSYNLEEIEDIGLIAQNTYAYAFSNCYALHTIAKMGVDELTKFSGSFASCNALENLTIEGTIGQNGFNVQWSTLLTHKSLMSIINALKDYSSDTSGTEWSITIGPENKAKLTTEELQIARNKGWQVN